MLDYKMKYNLRDFLQKQLPVSQIQPLPLTSKGTTYITIALKRSGHHAIINWLCHHLKSAIHLNHCTFIRKNQKMMIIPCAGRFVYYKNQERLDSGCLLNTQSNYSLDLLFEEIKQIGKFENLLYSFEEIDLNNPYLKKFIKRYHPIVILIIRDPYNCFASAFQHHDGKNTLTELAEKKEKLISYLKQALGTENYINYPIIPIDYGKWVQDKFYRGSLLKKLDTPFCDKAESSIAQIQPFGEGSSFDGTQIDYNSLQKRVFNRWKMYQNNSDYLNLLNDDLLSNITWEFFGLQKPF